MPRAGLTLGIDEAGRGPILGPMVLACVGLTDGAVEALSSAGLKDSKLFGSGQKAHRLRSALLPLIYQHANHISLHVLPPEKIDEYTHRGKLNLLEQESASALLKAAPSATRIVADGKNLFSPLCEHFPQLEALNKAESVHLSVAAASIIAKAKRDELWLEIVQKYRPEFGELIGPGWGYLNAPTRAFLRAYCAKYRQPPDEGRKSWPWTFAADLL